MFNDAWEPRRKARLAAEQAAAQAEAERAEAERLWLQGVPGDPGEPGQSGTDGLQGPAGPPGPPGPHVISAVMERGAYGRIDGILETLSDGSTRHFTVVRVDDRPVELRLDS